jgi:DNA/RNA endonuclease YhcR with UshA esterase domain
MIQNKNIIGAALIVLAGIFTGCEKDFDVVPVKELPLENIISIDSLRNIHVGSDTTIVGDYSIFGVVTADEASGNIFKELFIQDNTNAIKLELTSSSNIFIGDRVRVALKGATLRVDREMMFLEGLNPDVAVIKQDEGLDLTPEVVTILDINNLTGTLSSYQSKLVQINGVEFDTIDVCNSWADPINQSDENRNLMDAIGNVVIVRSSGFANFAGSQLPFGNGSIVGVVSQFDGTIQLTIRDPNEFAMTGTRNISPQTNCPVFSNNKDFDDQSVTSGGWSTQVVVGTFDWVTSDQGVASGDYYAVMSNFNGGNTASEAWLISPSFNFSTFTNPTLSFMNAANFSGAQLEVLVSTDYDGISLPATATWAPLTVNLSAGGFAFVPSGIISLSAFLGANTHVAFKYTGTNSDGKTWEVDKIKIEVL